MKPHRKLRNLGPVRRIVLTCSPIESTKNSIELENDIQTAISEANTQLVSLIHKLKELTYSRARYVEYSYEARNINIAKGLIQSDDCSRVRVIVPLVECPLIDTTDTECLYNLNVSHLIEIKLGKYKFIETLAKGGIRIGTTTEELPELLRDIALDISMSYALHGFCNLKSRPEFIYEYSKIKSDYVKEHSTTTRYGIIPEEADYASVAFLSHDGNSIDISILYNHWINFLKSLNSSNNPLLKSLSLPVEKFTSLNSASILINNIFYDHMQYKQLPLKKLESQFNKIDNGQYVLVRQDKMVRDKIYKKKILQLMQYRVSRVGNTRIVPIGELYKFGKVDNYLSFYYFEK